MFKKILIFLFVIILTFVSCKALIKVGELKDLEISTESEVL